MAIKLRIKDLQTTQPDGNGGQMDLSISGNFILTCEYFDDAKPNVVLSTQGFTLPTELSPQEILEYIRKPAQVIARARTSIATARTLVGREFDAE